MVLTGKVKGFIEENIELIEQNRWKEFYDIVDKELYSLYDTGMLAYALLKADINPLYYLDSIPVAFLSSTDITEFIVPNNIVAIQPQVFQDCQYLTKVVIPESVIVLGVDVFNGCYKLKEIIYLGTKDEWTYQIDKPRKWYVDSGIKVIHCNDGDIDIRWRY